MHVFAPKYRGVSGSHHVQSFSKCRLVVPVKLTSYSRSGQFYHFQSFSFGPKNCCLPRVGSSYFRPFQSFSFIEIAILRRVPLIVSFSGDGVRLVTLNDSVAPGRSASLLKFNFRYGIQKIDAPDKPVKKKTFERVSNNKSKTVQIKEKKKAAVVKFEQ